MTPSCYERVVNQREDVGVGRMEHGLIKVM